MLPESTNNSQLQLVASSNSALGIEVTDARSNPPGKVPNRARYHQECLPNAPADAREALLDSSRSRNAGPAPARPALLRLSIRSINGAPFPQTEALWEAPILFLSANSIPVPQRCAPGCLDLTTNCPYTKPL